MKCPAKYQGDYKGNEALAKLVSMLVPGMVVLGNNKLNRWYESNPYHKYHPGDILMLSSRRRLGYGIRPVVLVEDYQMREAFWNSNGVAGMYVIAASRDVFGESIIWMKENKIPRGVERITERSLEFKWNIEYGFKRVKSKNVEEAVNQYRSIEVDPKSMKFKADQIKAPLKPGDISLERGFSLELQE